MEFFLTYTVATILVLFIIRALYAIAKTITLIVDVNMTAVKAIINVAEQMGFLITELRVISQCLNNLKQQNNGRIH